MKYFDENNFEKFKADRIEYMKAFYLDYWVENASHIKGINVDPNDKLMKNHEDELVSLFKQNAIYKEISEDDGWVEYQWVVDEKFARKVTDDYLLKAAPTYDSLIQRQQEIQNQIYDQVYYEKKQGKRLADTSAIELLSKLDSTTNHETRDLGFAGLRIKIASLADTKDELDEMFQKIKEEKPFIFYYGHLGNPSEMIEQIASDNNTYKRFKKEVKEAMIDHFFKKMPISKQTNLLTLQCSLKRTEISDFLADLNKDERMKNIDILLQSPTELNNYFHFEGLVLNTAKYLNAELGRRGKDEEIEKAMLPITTMIKFGGVDIEEQKERFGKVLPQLENEIKQFGTSDYNDVLNKIESIIDRATQEREQMIDKNTVELFRKTTHSALHDRFIPNEIRSRLIGNFTGLSREEKTQLEAMMYENMGAERESKLLNSLYNNQLVQSQLFELKTARKEEEKKKNTPRPKM